MASLLVYQKIFTAEKAQRFRRPLSEGLCPPTSASFQRYVEPRSMRQRQGEMRCDPSIGCEQDPLSLLYQPTMPLQPALIRHDPIRITLDISPPPIPSMQFLFSVLQVCVLLSSYFLAPRVKSLASLTVVRSFTVHLIIPLACYLDSTLYSILQLIPSPCGLQQSLLSLPSWLSSRLQPT